MIRIILLAAVAFCLTEASGYGYAHGQQRVNAIANSIGAGTGTAYKDGVPGTPYGVTGHDRYSYGHGRGYGGYGHGGYGHAGYGGGYAGHYAGHGYGGYGGNYGVYY